MDTTKAQQAWEALQAFYAFKAKLLPTFLQKNIRNINSIEKQLMREYESHMRTAEPGWSIGSVPL